MFQSITSLFGNLVSATPFSLKELQDFPYSDYTELQSIYSELNNWYTGLALDETQKQGDKDVELYPLHLNPVRSALMKHVHTLFGEIPDAHYGSLVVPRVIIRNGKPERNQAERVEQFLLDTCADNNFTSLQQENAINSQVFGGCIFKVSWLPGKTQKDGRISIEKVVPTEFMCVPYMNNPWRLRKAWIIRSIDEYTARQFGVELNAMTGWYIEEWEETKYRIAINNSPVLQGDGNDLKEIGGANPFGFVPFVYIPHERSSTFWGESVITDAVIGITKEKNLRMADAGDATSDESHSLLIMSNVRGSPTIKRIGRHIPVVDLGSSQSISPGSDPDLRSVKRSSLSETMIALTKNLHSDFRREVYVPAVADGEDEGSQRSGVTLANRMWPLVAHTKGERVHWSTGMTQVFKMILAIAARKGVGSITTSDLDMKLRCKWYSSLPRDREQLSTELIGRAGQNLGSHEHLIELFGDIDDIGEDMDQTKEWLEFQAELKKQAAPEPLGGENGSEGNSGGSRKAQRNGRQAVSNSNEAAGD